MKGVLHHYKDECQLKLGLQFSDKLQLFLKWVLSVQRIKQELSCYLMQHRCSISVSVAKTMHFRGTACIINQIPAVCGAPPGVGSW